ncbi:MAG: beta strand repeat-containing protein [Promethearchaeota archaeon]
MKKTNNKRKTIILAIILINILLIPYISQILTKHIPKEGLNLDFKPIISQPPLVDINDPNENELFGSTPPDYNVTITDGGAGVNETWYQLNNGTLWSGNFTFSGSTGTINKTDAWDLFDNGTVTVTFFANSTLGELNSSQVVLRKDLDSPTVVIVSPSAGTYGSGSLLINASITDSSSTISNAIAMINASTPFNISLSQSGNYWSGNWDNISSYTTGDYEIRIWAIDDKGNADQTQSVVITIDLDTPTVVIISPLAGTYGSGSLLINASVTDSLSSVSNAIAMINASTPFNITLSQSGNYWSGYWNNISSYTTGDYEIRIWAIDDEGNVDQTQTVVITIDLDSPTVVIVSPTAGTFGSGSLLINASVTDSLSSISNAIAMFNASTPFNISLSQSGNYWSGYWNNISSYTSGDYEIRIWAIDDEGNADQTQSVVITIDVDGPTVVLISPTAGIYGSGSLLINASVIDSLSSVSNAIAMINASTPFNISLSQSGNYWSGYWNNISSYTSGDYEIRIWAIDDKGNVDQTQTVVITIDIGAPVVTIIAPTAGTYGSGSLLINASVTDSLSSVSNAIAMINSSTPFNISLSQSGNYWSGYWNNISSYTTGDYEIRIWAIDNEGNADQTQSVVITIDLDAPTVVIVSPAAGTYGSGSLLINASVTDLLSSVSNAFAMINASTPFNITLSQSGNYWSSYWNNISSYTTGDYEIRIWAIDDKGNVDQTQTVVITIDLDSPTVVIVSPSAGTYGSSPLLINASVTDLLSAVSNVIAMINASTPFNISLSQSGNYWSGLWNNISSYTSGDYEIRIWAIDDSGNADQTQTVIITIDTGAPIVTIITPTAGIYGSSPLLINASVTDSLSSVSNVIAMINASTPFNISLSQSGNYWSGTWNNISTYGDGDYEIRIWAIDDKGNINQAETVVITIDTGAPIVTIITPNCHD